MCYSQQHEPLRNLFKFFNAFVWISLAFLVSFEALAQDKPVITISKIDFNNQKMDCGGDGCVDGCFAKPSVTSSAIELVDQLSVSFEVINARNGDQNVRMDIHGNQASIGAPFQIVGHTIQQTCENVDRRNPIIECTLKSGGDCRNFVKLATAKKNIVENSTSCKMRLGHVHSDSEETEILQSTKGLPSLFYRAKMNVNTDGSPRSYHPYDPRGESKALNNIANAIGGIFSKFLGETLGCTPRRGACYERYISTFEKARDSGYDPSSNWITTYGMIPWSKNETLKRDAPCTIHPGEYEGFFVSPTAYTLYNGKKCDQSRYIDSLKINANVLPSGSGWSSQGIVTDGFDLVVFVDEADRVVYGINGDRGPKNKIGEVSVAAAAGLAGIDVDKINSYSDVKRIAQTKISYLIFPAVDIKRLLGRKFNQDDIDRLGKETLSRWGGIDRIRACKREVR